MMLTNDAIFTTRLQKGGALLDDMRQLVCQWTEAVAKPESQAGEILHKATRSRVADTYRRAFLPRFLKGSPQDAWKLARALEEAHPSIEIIRPFYYWITARAEPILYAYVTEELVEKAKTSDRAVRTEETASWINNTLRSCGRVWSPTVQLKVARGILAALRDFAILEGAVNKRLVHGHLPIETFCLIAFLLNLMGIGARELVEHSDWKLFLLAGPEVERLFFEAHQHGWLHYQAAGRVHRIEFPTNDFKDYIRVIFGTES
ncbi:hypothetical protein GSU2110 [Geobacter sulfurreducens PCA]|uniref:DUF1819 domain-containing protein n=1 Tax=Geobacter sulfurreducens (strain ATCC 51573 / DSM 12127 / PCA) TaxID=243231 RepID=Q74BD1_GEOSL|nr:hypothetical protein GSU2110 [Geobacter sulfurreducens PCA]HCD97609.1 DUF1819 domain-containing protein [Geobacter sulfurreducens]